MKKDKNYRRTRKKGNKVDPLGITYLRIRGMWGINNPINVFSYIKDINPINDKNHSLNVIMLNNKWVSFPEEDRNNLELLQNTHFQINNVKIKSPNNPAKMLDAKFLRYRG